MSDTDADDAPATQNEPSRWNFPNLLCLIRLAGAPVLIGMAIADQPTAFVVLLFVLLLTDWLDGKLAVRWHQQTRFGARLDSVADAAMYGALVFGAGWLKWEELRGDSVWFALALGSYAVTSLAGWWKFGRVPSYHTRAAKSCWLLVSIATVALFAEWSLIPVRVACVAVALTNLEATAITAVLPKWQANVPTLWHAWRMREASAPP